MSDRDALPSQSAATPDGLSVTRIDGDPGLSFAGFVSFIASIMALNALGIDSMLPALPAIGRALGVPSENERQWIIVIYLLGFGGGQIIWGPLADRYGRKPILAVSLLFYSVFAFLAGFAASFPLLLGARLLQGIAASASRVLVVSIVRDCYSGRRMARVMSLAFMVFLAVPILAPSVGQVITLLFGSWRSIFYAIGAYGVIIGLICTFRLKETLHPEYRHPISTKSVLGAMKRVVVTRVSIGYTIAAAFCFGCISGFVTSAQQIFADVFHVPTLFPVLFATVATGMGAASFLNSRLVERYGTRRLSHAAMLGFVVAGCLHLSVAIAGYDSVILFPILQATQMFFFGLMNSNFSSMAMEPLGDIAGAGSSVQGFLSTCIGALLGSIVGQSFNGSTIPVSLGFTVLGVATVAAVFWTERGKLFRPHHAVAKVG